MFVELEQVFRDTFQSSTDRMDVNLYQSACTANDVIQNCFFSATYSAAHSKENVFSNIISLYFKVRVHHKCKTIVDTVRSKKNVSGKVLIIIKSQSTDNKVLLFKVWLTKIQVEIRPEV